MVANALTIKEKLCYYRRFSDAVFKTMSAFVIDAFEFCRLKARQSGEIAVAALPRLVGEAANRSGVLRWSLQGDADDRGRPRLALTVSGTVQLRCQRCLAPFPYEITSESVLILAVDEASADEIDAMLEDDAIEVIVGSKAQNVDTLVEDEALLALPLAPKHAICPDQSQAAVVKDEKKESPFAILKNLKH